MINIYIIIYISIRIHFTIFTSTQYTYVCTHGHPWCLRDLERHDSLTLGNDCAVRFEPAFHIAAAAVAAKSVGEVLAFTGSSLSFVPETVPYMLPGTWRMSHGSLTSVTPPHGACISIYCKKLQVEGIIQVSIRIHMVACVQICPCPSIK